MTIHHLMMDITNCHGDMQITHILTKQKGVYITSDKIIVEMDNPIIIHFLKWLNHT